MQVNSKYKLLIASTSTIHGSGYLEYVLNDAVEFLATDEILFIPYAMPSGISYDEYTELPQEDFNQKIIKEEVLNEFEKVKAAIENEKAIFVGGGNTFLLLISLYDLALMDVLRKVVATGTLYKGSSAGSHVTRFAIGT